MSYRYNSTDKDKFSLHDCRSDHIELEDGRLTFFFPSGSRRFASIALSSKF